MTYVQTEAAVQSDALALTVLMRLTEGKIEDAIACFAEEFRFKDHGIELEFKDKDSLTEFFQKARELYPDSVQVVDRIFVSDDHVVTEWTFRATLTAPFYGGLTQKVPISLHGASIVRIADGKITDWADYYDGLTSRRSALAAHFKEWVEL